MDKYLITGCSGFVGTHFLDFLEDNKIDCEVLALDLHPINLHREFHYVKIYGQSIDLLNKTEVEKYIIEFTPKYILHLAAFSSVAFSWEHPDLCFNNNVNVFLNILEIIRKNRLSTRILSIGSSEEYGIISEDNIPITENQPLNPISPYAIARVSQELLSKMYADSYGLDIIMTRSFNHIGPRQKEIFVVPSFVKQILKRKNSGEKDIILKTGNISIIRDFTDVRDVVKAYYLLLKFGRKGNVYNICSGNPTKISEIVEIIGSLLDVKVDTSISPELIRPNDNPIIVGDNSLLKEHTEWKPSYNLPQSIKDIISYWQNV